LLSEIVHSLCLPYFSITWRFSIPMDIISYQSRIYDLICVKDICLLSIQCIGLDPIISFYRASYASAVLGVVILFVRLSVRHTRALWLIQRTYRRYFYTSWKGNPSRFLMPKISAKFQRGDGVTPNGGAK